MQNLKRNYTNELIYKKETQSQTWENELMVTGGKGGQKG